MMIIQREWLTPALMEEMREYFELGYEDYGDTEDSKLDPNWEAYSALQLSNSLFIFTVRDEEKLVGYAWYITMPSLHSRTQVYAIADTIYLDKVYRGRFIGLKLFNEAEKILKANGVSLVICGVKQQDNWGKLLERNNYYLAEYNYQKDL